MKKQIYSEAKQLAEKYNGVVLNCMEYGKLVAYKVMLKESQLVVIFKNRNVGEL